MILYKAILICLFFHSLLAEQTPFYHPLTHRFHNQITGYTILSERCSGNCFIDALMRDNFPTIMRAQKFAHKHFFPWFDLPESGEYVQSPWRIDEEAFLKDSDDTLFIFVIRRHEDWLRSFFLEPNYVPKEIKNHSFFHFVHSEWKIDIPVLAIDYYKKNLPKGWTFTWPYPLNDDYYDSNVYASRHFRNILELRSYKVRNYLQIGSKVKNFIVLRYENVRDDPEGCVQYISALYGIPNKDPFIPIIKHRGINESPVIYKRETFFPIPFYVQAYINKNLDWETEKILGYLFFPE